MLCKHLGWCWSWCHSSSCRWQCPWPPTCESKAAWRTAGTEERCRSPPGCDSSNTEHRKQKRLFFQRNKHKQVLKSVIFYSSVKNLQRVGWNQQLKEKDQAKQNWELICRDNKAPLMEASHAPPPVHFIKSASVKGKVICPVCFVTWKAAEAANDLWAMTNRLNRMCCDLLALGRRWAQKLLN